MLSSVTLSTFFLTLLLAVGLFFFIRASAKDRTEAARFTSPQPEETLALQLRQYFAQRSYRVAQLDAAQNQVTFEGEVRPSWFLAIFLTGLAGVGLACLALVLSLALPQISAATWGLLILAPIAGIFYWKRAGRTERVCLKIESRSDRDADGGSAVEVTAHRDEIAAMRRSLPLQPQSG